LDDVEQEAMIQITVRISGHLRKFGEGERILSLPRTATVLHVLNALADSSPELRAALFSASGEPNAQILLFVDDEQAHAGQPLAEARSVTLMLPISGG
jgi:molybdopterin converting factor small subunit